MSDEKIEVTEKATRTYVNAGWKVRREGVNVYMENMRFKYHAVIGDTYKERDDEVPKKLEEIVSVGGRWKVALAPMIPGSRGRVVALENFCVRYLKGEAKPAVRPARPPRAPKEEAPTLKQLDAKLDACIEMLATVMRELGIKPKPTDTNGKG